MARTVSPKNSPSKKSGAKEAIGGDPSGIKMIPDGKYPLVLHADISFPPRPEPGQEIDALFFNPRPLEEVLDAEKMGKLVYSIRLEDLLEPVTVNLVTMNGDKTIINKVELLAGERRDRAIGLIIEQKLPCVDEVNPKPDQFEPGAVVNWKNRFGVAVKQVGGVVAVTFDDHLNDIMGKGEQDCPYAEVLPTILGNEKHKYVPCKCYYDLTDERKMRISFSENDNSEPLSVKAEVDLVERLLRRDKKQAEVAYILNTNITFVSQRACFRSQLPPEAFEKLMSGKMAAHVAVGMLGFEPEVRQSHFDAMKADEAATTNKKRAILRSEKERMEDEAELHKDAAVKAARGGDEAAAAKENRRAESAEGKAKRIGERQTRVEQEAGSIKEGHSKRAAATLGISPRKKKMLAKEQVETIYVKGLSKFVAGGEIDPICGEEIPGELISIVSPYRQGHRRGSIGPACGDQGLQDRER